MIVSGWVDWATHIKPEIRPDKRYAQANIGKGIVWHSQEGYGLQSMLNIMRGDDRQTSFMFWISVAGELVQMAPTEASVWTSGNKTANTSYWPVECEGTVETGSLSGPQVNTCRRLIRDWEDYKGLVAARHVTMFEHREVALLDEVNAGPTACPSGRYLPLWALLEGGEMTEEDVRAIVREELEAAGLVADDLPTFARYYEAMLARLYAATAAFDPDEVPE